MRGNALKVVQVLPALESGGVERGTLEIARALVDAGHESIVVSRGGRLVPQLAAEGSRHVAWDIGRKHPATLLLVPRFRRWLAAEQPAILHARSRLPAWVCWLAWRRMPGGQRPRLVTTVHGLYSVGAYSAIMTRGERVIVVSDTAKRYVQDNYPRTDATRLVRIYRGVDRQRFHGGYRPSADWLAEWRAAFPETEGKALVVLPGRMTRLKGHIDFIDAIERLRESHPDAMGLVVGGDDPRHPAYADDVKQRGAGLLFTGHRTDLREIMAIASAVVSLSQKPESFGRTVLGGVGEILSHVYPAGRTPAGDVDAVVERLAAVIDDPEAARSAIRDHDFDVDRMCAGTLAVYHEVARDESPPGQLARVYR